MKTVSGEALFYLKLLTTGFSRQYWTTLNLVDSDVESQSSYLSN